MSNNKGLKRKELYDLVWSKPISKILEDYAVTYSVFKSLCKKKNIPLPKTGYWQKLKHNKKPVITALPDLKTEETLIVLPKSIPGEDDLSQLSELALLTREIKKDNKLNLIVPKKLSKPEKITLATKRYYKEVKASKRPYSIKDPEEGRLSISVSDNSVNRALLFWDSFIKLLVNRGHKVEVIRNHKYSYYNGTKFVIHGEYFKIRLREKDRRVMEDTGHKWKTAKYYPTGNFVLKVDEFPEHEWQDTKTKTLEDKLANILAYLELWAKRRTKERIENEIWNREYERKRKIEEEQKQRRTEELNKFRSIINESSRWQKAMNLRNYINVIEKDATQKNKLNNQLKEWLNWLKDKIDWYDPLIEKDDELFKNIDRDSL
ncbi:hypothetical protein [Snuella lapsa]|uniref:Uncharacterized protein n=1 Tax=Snuella lapsa TaxID=870481 RepID=A0ABP6WS20_9FLAO